MSVAIKYVGSSGNAYNLKADGLRLKEAGFHGYSWDPDTSDRQYGTRVNRFTRGAATYEAVLQFRGSYSTRRDAVEAIYEDFETDILSQEPGRIYWGSCYIDCYAIAHDTYPDDANRYTEREVSFYCPYPFWIEETSYEIGMISESASSDTDKGYDSGYAYSYSYAVSQTVKQITLDHYGLASYKLVAIGPASYVSVSINGTLRTVNYAVGSGETLTIDTRPNLDTEKRIYVTALDGTTESVFDYRDPSSGIFDKIEPGTVSVDYSRAYAIILTFYAERSEPKHG